MHELLQSLTEKDIKDFFNEKIKLEVLKIGNLSEKELTTLQDRVRLYIEIREEFISIRNQST